MSGSVAVSPGRGGKHNPPIGKCISLRPDTRQEAGWKMHTAGCLGVGLGQYLHLVSMDEDVCVGQ